MKQILTLALLLLLSLRVAVFAETHAWPDTRLNLPDTEMTIDQLFKTIHAQTGMSVVYNVKDMRYLKRVKVVTPNPTVKEALDEVLNPKQVSYVIEKNTIVIKQLNGAVSGVVRDKNTGEPLVGASVFDKNGKTDVVTGLDGEYTLYAKKGATITVTYIGYEPQSHKDDGKEIVNFDLVPDEHSLEDVVVTGYKIVDKRASTSAITSIKAEDILRPDAMSIDQMLEGQCPTLCICRIRESRTRHRRSVSAVHLQSSVTVNRFGW